MKKIFTLLLIVCSLSSFAQNISLCYRDFDEDGYGDPNNFVGSGIFCPIGYVSDNTDCDDHDRSIHLLVWYRDLDNDGYGDGTFIESCVQPGAGYTDRILPTIIDCNDNDPNDKPIKWYFDRDRDGYAYREDWYIISCTLPALDYVSEFLLKGFDCQDADANWYPRQYYTDADGDGYRSGASPIESCSPSTDPALHLASEFNSLDIDCDDGDALIGTGPAWYKDQDNDGYTDGTILRSCVQPGGYIGDPRTETITVR